MHIFLNPPVAGLARLSFWGFVVIALLPLNTSAQQKPDHGVSQDLLDLFEQSRTARAAGDHGLSYVRDGDVVIDAASEDPDALLADLTALGLRNGAVYGRVVSGLLPIEAIGALPSLRSLRLARPAYAMSGRAARDASGRTGSVDSQGDAAMMADDARTLYSIDGTGITTGTLSDSYNCLGGAPGDVSTDDLPTGVTVISDFAGAGCIDEGRAMMQIIHDVAPGVAQGFHTAFNGQADFALGIEELAGCPAGSGAGCTAVAGFAADVITDDVYYFAEPFFQDGVIAQAVDNVVANDVVYFTFAGNHGLESYEAPYRSSGQAGGGGGTLHDFDPGAGVDVSQRISVPAGTIANPRQVVFSFQWANRYFSVSGLPGAVADLDIFIRDTNGNLIASSTNANVGADPIEVFTFSNNGTVDADGNGIPDTQFDIQIELASGAAPPLIKYIALVNGGLNRFTQTEWDTQSSTVYGHMNSATAEVVGAADYRNTPEFGVDPPQIEAFSSAGPTPIYFDVNGNAVGLVNRNNPAIVAPNDGNNTFFGNDSDGDGFPNFSGTSAAAPHAAGAGALLLEAAGGPGSLTPALVYADLESTAVDMDDPLTPGFDIGFDFRTGAGLINLLEAAHLYLNAPPVADAGADATVECGAPSGTSVSLDGTGSTDPEGDALTYTWTGPFPEGGGTTSGATPTVTLPKGVHMITLKVEDGNGGMDTDTVTITVEDTTRPVVTLAGESEVTLECAVDKFMDPGASAADACDGPLAVTVSGAVDTSTPGTYELTYSATDDAGNTGTATRTVEVVDTTPPLITVGAEPLSLWPPNHKYQNVDLANLDLAVSDLCDTSLSADDALIAEVTSDEPEETPDLGDGETFDDIVIATECRAVDVRSERQRNGDGRVYEILVGVADASDNASFAPYTVHVPETRMRGPLAVQGPDMYTVPGCSVPADALASDTPEPDDEARREVEARHPEDYVLSQNAPNPFRSATAIAYGLPESGAVTIRVVNAIGQDVAVLVAGDHDPGTYEVMFNADTLSPGVYVYVLSVNGRTISRQMALVR